MTCSRKKFRGAGPVHISVGRSKHLIWTAEPRDHASEQRLAAQIHTEMINKQNRREAARGRGQGRGRMDRRQEEPARIAREQPPASYAAEVKPEHDKQWGVLPAWKPEELERLGRLNLRSGLAAVNATDSSITASNRRGHQNPALSLQSSLPPAERLGFGFSDTRSGNPSLWNPPPPSAPASFGVPAFSNKRTSEFQQHTRTGATSRSSQNQESSQQAPNREPSQNTYTAPQNPHTAEILWQEPSRPVVRLPPAPFNIQTENTSHQWQPSVINPSKRVKISTSHDIELAQARLRQAILQSRAQKTGASAPYDEAGAAEQSDKMGRSTKKHMTSEKEHIASEKQQAVDSMKSTPMARSGLAIASPPTVSQQDQLPTSPQADHEPQVADRQETVSSLPADMAAFEKLNYQTQKDNIVLRDLVNLLTEEKAQLRDMNAELQRRLRGVKNSISAFVRATPDNDYDAERLEELARKQRELIEELEF
ncbi:uncharacterized protein BP5553_06285 [Venustampulla echinocandica]|uniref:Uncharacterized protein n=1 Tax=Venustampulla echinocandica TaxID=2656787 RepID=A0A370TJI0_9HELO|nr:uncharacterized protein BP5553_06285 [Venustampulla echinocandica]RDL35673.1 hypothetical protein BP5553_06285 [Venustampulla echinocandica]